MKLHLAISRHWSVKALAGSLPEQEKLGLRREHVKCVPSQIAAALFSARSNGILEVGTQVGHAVGGMHESRLR